MTYVDAAIWPFRGMKMCHLSADTVDELHEFAGRLGLRRSWFQLSQRDNFPHYDITKSKRALAVQMGAREVNRVEMVDLVHRWRTGQLPARPPEPKQQELFA